MAFGERKPKFRARKLDFNKALQVFRFDQAVDLDDYGSPLRSVAQVATGVDKEEEDEHHLKAALSAAATQSQTYYIPTPEAHPAPTDYDALYPKKFKQSKQYIKWSGKTIEDLTADQPHYDADKEDIGFVESQKVPLDIFEHIIEAFEDTAYKLSQNAVTLDVLERFTSDKTMSKKMPDSKMCDKILAFWHEKRLKLNRSLICTLKYEDLTSKIGADPYVCFRRREIKAPRKTRRTDAQCMDKLRKVHYDLATCKALMEAGLKRDKYKKESLVMETSLFEAYWTLECWKKQAGRPEDWPLPEVPSFRMAAQSILEPKKKKARPTSGPSAVAETLPTSRSTPTQSLLKSTKFYKPYYPIEVLRQIQKDMELIMVDEATRIEDVTVNLPDDLEQAIYCDATNSRWSNGIRKPTGLPCFARFRVGRSGMVQLDRKTIHSPSESRPRMEYSGSARVKLLNARDCSHLHNVFVGNYNQHYIQTTNHINQPLSYNAWVAATGPITQALLGGNGANKIPRTGGSNSGSPKKGLPAKPGEAESVVPESASASSGQSGDQTVNSQSQLSFSQQHPAGIASLSGNSQITVKVKSRPADNR